jgi:REP element-mobilizing transposase RayT
MPRGLRIDAPGTLQHVTFRGVNGCPIFTDDFDRLVLLGLMNVLFVQLGFACFAWVFMSNHVHFVLQTGSAPLPILMHRLGTAYATYFNRRSGRRGHLWQDRYWSRPVEEDAETVAAYVHDNPRRAGLMAREQLATNPWCGLSGQLGSRPRLAFEIASARVPRPQRDPQPLEVRCPRESLATLIARVCEEQGIAEELVRSGRRTSALAQVRARVVRCAVDEGGYRSAEVARALGLSESGICRLLRRRLDDPVKVSGSDPAASQSNTPSISQRSCKRSRRRRKTAPSSVATS